MGRFWLEWMGPGVLGDGYVDWGLGLGLGVGIMGIGIAATESSKKLQCTPDVCTCWGAHLLCCATQSYV